MRKYQIHNIALSSLLVLAISPFNIATAASNDACTLLTASEIAKSTGLTVGTGTAGSAIPGVLGKCTWKGEGDSKVIVTLADSQHMQMTIKMQEQSGGKAVAGIGSMAVGIEGAPFMGGGYIISAVDSKGGFGVSILGTKAGTRSHAIDLAKQVESHR